MGRHDSGKIVVLVLLSLGAVALASAVFLAALRAGPPPSIEIKPSGPAIGRKTLVTVTVVEPSRGLAGFRVELVQGDRVERLAERRHSPRAAWAFWGAKTERDSVTVEIGRDAVKSLKAGPATVRVVASRAAAWLRRPDPVVEETALPVRLTPPSLQILSTATYVSQGGCEAVVYRAGETAIRDGVRSGGRWFPGGALPGGGPRDRFALFTVPYDTADVSGVRLVAEDDAGNAAEMPFVDKFFPKRLPTATFELPDSFLGKVVPEIISQTVGFADRGGLLQNYLAINRDLRRENAAELARLCEGSKPAFLWSRSFVALRNAKVMESFATRRTYVYQGRVVDRQDHLGWDLAATRAVPVPAANRGVVLLARYLGIYGNSVVLDHGYGLATLYGHLSSIDVKEGQEVEQGATLGRTGETGLAGGDHLHFSVLLQGIPVDPGEWVDGHWIRDRIARKLGPAFKFEE